MASNKYTYSVLTSSFNTPDEIIDYAFQVGPLTWQLVANMIALMKKEPCLDSVSINPPDGDCKLLEIGEEAEQLSEAEHYTLRQCRPVVVHPDSVDDMKLSESQYTYHIEIIQRATQIQVVLVVGDDPLSEALCHLDKEDK